MTHAEKLPISIPKDTWDSLRAYYAFRERDGLLQALAPAISVWKRSFLAKRRRHLR